MQDDKLIHEELVSLRKLRDSLNERITLLEKQQRYRVALKVKNNGAIYNGVLSTDLIPYIQEWIDNGHTIRALADKANLAEDTIGRILRNEHTMVRTTTADRIITALGIPHIFSKLVPDPPEGQFYEE